MIVDVAQNYFKLAFLYHSNPNLRQSLASGALPVELNKTTNQYVRARIARLISSTK